MSRPAPGRAATAALALLVGAGLAVTALHFHLRSSLQAMEGTRPAGVGDTVTVLTDRFSVPHVFARDEADLHYAQGWLHAGQRLWQMELFRRVARGRLSELFGEEALRTDRLLRTLDLWAAAGRSVAALDPDDRAALEAYAAGVNARLESWEGAWPPEFVLLGIEPGRWTPRASMAVGKVMALDLSVWRRELSRFRSRRVLPAAKRGALAPSWPEWGPTVLPAYRPADPGAPRMAPAGAPSRGDGPGGGPPAAVRPRPGASPAAGGGDPARPGPGGAGSDAAPEAAPDRGGADARRWDPFRFLAGFSPSASNNWALGGSRTRSGHPLVANDMHLGLRAPALWYAMGLHAEADGLRVAGLTLPGAPGVVVGFNGGVAWSFTNGMVDDTDFAVEALGEEGRSYRTSDGWRRLSVRPETIRVRGRDEPVVHRVRETDRGPILTDALPGLSTPLSARWIGARPTREAAGLLAMNRAEDPEAFARAVAAFDSPQQNVIFAAADGTLGYRLSGRVPRRTGRPAPDAGAPAGMLPAPGPAVGAGDLELWPPGSHPAATAGPADGADGGDGARLTGDGFLASANNLQAPGLFGVIGVDYPVPFRARRIVDRLSRGGAWTAADAARLQRDTRSLLADRLGGRAADVARRAGADSAAALLEAWDRRVDRGSRAAAVFYAWVYRLRSLVAADELREAGEWGYFPISSLLRVLEEGDPAGWADDVTTPSVETLPETEARALRDAVDATGLAPWGSLHRERSSHPLGRAGWLDRVFHFHVGPYPSPGAPRTVRPDDYLRWQPVDTLSWRPPWTNDYGPSQRLVVELGPGPPSGRFLLPTGQAGNPLSEHYRDMSRRWRTDGELIELPLARERAEGRAVRRMRLVPRPGGEAPGSR